MGCGAVVVVAAFLERRLPAGVNGVPVGQVDDAVVGVR